MNRAMRNRVASIVLLSAITPIFTLLSGCGQGDTAKVEQHLHPVTTVALEKSQQLELNREFVGVVTPSQNGSIGFELSGKIAKILVDEGESVTNGQPLMQLDTRLLATETNQLIAQQRQVKSDLKLVNSNLERLESLKLKGYTSTQSVDEQIAKQNSLEAQLQQLRAGVNANAIKIEKSLLKAPFDGVIGKRQVSLGQVVSAGTPVYSLLLQQSNEAQVGVPSRMLGQLSVGDALPVTIGRQQYFAQLITKGAVIDPATRTVQLRLALPVESEVISGELAYLTLPEQIEREGYWLPLTALTDGIRGLWNVYALSEQGNGVYQIEKRDIRILYATGKEAYVQGAISEGEQVVSDGLHRYVPGQQVTLADQSSMTVVEQ
ncbi:Toluene efflux pump periplasmic linker protein TtgG [Sinobacterium norvegicum]|uniref:Toluene efflux pump periplasmic linker protein TtgG n=1 Tax=Sinobacterium norvegicum TaxID=1641715 RepID=A0ABN8EEB6_9GAMM|nr:efflux RND transporter periplasmic adaptor subunit [Sinobacterium norvegicum]CAH0990571.1 Toluene efflux pump periplasmic linker protein TtgG [Sinobacterium norvegicum]